MASKEVKITNVMSLEDNIRIIDTYNSLKSPTERKNFIDSHEKIKKIIKNRKQILFKQERLKSVNTVINLHKSISYEIQKISLLEKVLHEWFHRFTNRCPKGVISIKALRERADMAILIMNINSFMPGDIWLSKIRKTCSKGIAKYGSVRNESLPFDIKAIIRYVLEKEGISREKAQHTYGIQAFDEISDEGDHDLKPYEFIDNIDCDADEQFATSVEESLEGNESVEDVKDWSLLTSEETLMDNSECLKQENDVVTSTVEPTSNSVPINNDQDALQYLQPLRHYMFSQNNTIGLDLLTQMETILIKPEN